MAEVRAGVARRAEARQKAEAAQTAQRLADEARWRQEARSHAKEDRLTELRRLLKNLNFEQDVTYTQADRALFQHHPGHGGLFTCVFTERTQGDHSDLECQIDGRRYQMERPFKNTGRYKPNAPYLCWVSRVLSIQGGRKTIYLVRPWMPFEKEEQKEAVETEIAQLEYLPA